MGEQPAYERVPITRLKPQTRNPRTHFKKQIDALARSIDEFGFINPVIIDDDGQVLVGNGRLEAAKLLGLDEVPAVRVTHLTPAAARAYALADNRLAEKAGWDRELLALELQELQMLLPEIDLDLEITGFETARIDLLLEDHDDSRPGPADDLPEMGDEPVSGAGELYLLGRHRLLVGDARQADAFTRLMGGASAKMAILDVPYNVKIRLLWLQKFPVPLRREFLCKTLNLLPKQTPKSPCEAGFCRIPC